MAKAVLFFSRKVSVIKSGYTDDLESSQPPTPSVYQQILDKLNNIDGGSYGNGYRSNGDMRMKLEQMMNEATTEHEREAIRNALDRM